MVDQPTEYLRFRVPSDLAARARAEQRRGKPGTPVPRFSAVLRTILVAGLATLEAAPVDASTCPVRA